MFMFEISIKSCFCGAHFLKGYEGKCANLHGHNWEVEVFLRGSRTNRLGILVDFQHAKKLLQDVLSKIDHQNLNQLPPFKKENPSAENIAKFIFNELVRKIKPRVSRGKVSNYRLQRVRVSETPGNSAFFGPKL